MWDAEYKVTEWAHRVALLLTEFFHAVLLFVIRADVFSFLDLGFVSGVRKGQIGEAGALVAVLAAEIFLAS